MEESRAIVVVEGVVVEGDHRGRELGFPTANVMAESEDASLADGVYGGHVTRADGSVYDAAISIGSRPTYYQAGGPRLVEAHLIDFDGDLYGEKILIRVEVHLRNQLRFNTSADLIAQIRDDVKSVRTRRDAEQSK